MAVTITGSKYSGTISSVGTITRLVNSGASFSSGDFNAGRIIGLWNSAGTTFKGLAWIRRWISSTEIELVKAFIDKEGNTVTQTVGDTYQVSLNFADVVQTGIAVSNNSVTITDTVTFGSGNSLTSACFYDEGKTINVSSASFLGGSGAPFFAINSGLFVLGALIDYTTAQTYKGCTILNNNSVGSLPNGTGTISPTGSNAMIWMLGGAVISAQGPTYLPASYTSGYGAGFNVNPSFQKYWNVYTNAALANGYASAPSATNEFLNPFSTNSVNLGSNVSWAGRLQGGTYELIGSVALNIFGADAAGTYSYSAPAGEFLTVLDCGFGSRPAFWRSNTAVTQTINLTNVVTPNRNFGWDGPGTNLPGSNANNNATGIFRFSGRYTNAINGSLALVKNNGLLSTVQDSATVSSNQVVLTVQEASVTGFTETVTENAWVYGFYLYGYQIATGSFSTSSTTVAGGQTAKRVVLGGTIGQIVDVNITQATVATVAAYSTLNNSDRVYDYAQYWKSLNTTNAVYPAYNTQLISNTGGTLSTSQNVTIDTTAGSVFAVNTGTSTITIKPTSALVAGTKSSSLQIAASRTLRFNQNGDKSGFSYLIPATGIVVVPSGATNLQNSIFTSGATINVISGSATVTVDADQVANITAGSGVTIQAPSVNLSFTGLLSNSEVRVYNTNSTSDSLDDTEIGGVENSGTSFSLTYSGTPTIRYIIMKLGYKVIENTITLSGSNTSIPISQQRDSVYSNP